MWVTTQWKRKLQNTQKHLRKSVGDTFLFYRNDRGYLVTGLLIARSKFLQRNVYASMLKEKDTCQIKTNERFSCQSLSYCWLVWSQFLSRQILIIQRISFMSCLSNYYGFFLVQYLLLLSCYLIQSFFGRSLPGFIFLAWDLWFCLLFFIHLLWLPRQEQKTGSVLDQSPFFNHQNLWRYPTSFFFRE